MACQNYGHSRRNVLGAVASYCLKESTIRDEHNGGLLCSDIPPFACSRCNLSCILDWLILSRSRDLHVMYSN